MDGAAAWCQGRSQRQPHVCARADHLGLVALEVVDGDRLVGGQAHEPRAPQPRHVGLHAVGEHVGHLAHELVERLHGVVDAVQVRVDVHARPREHVQPRLDLLLQVHDVGLHQPLEHVRDRPLDALGLLEHVRELVVVGLELVLLQQHHLGRLGDLDAHALQVLGLAHKLQDVAVEVDQQPAVLRVADQERGLQAGLVALDLGQEVVDPEHLELNERLRHAVVHAHHALGLLRRHDGLVARELAHGLLDAPQELPSPHDVAGDRRGVARHGRVVFVLLVHGLHVLQVEAVVVEDDHVLVLEIRAQRVALQDGLELLQQVERLLGRADVLERRVDEALQLRLQVVDLDLEVHEVAVELRVGEVQQVVRLALHVVGNLRETLDHRLEALDVRVLRQRRELTHCGGARGQRVSAKHIRYPRS